MKTTHAKVAKAAKEIEPLRTLRPLREESFSRKEAVIKFREYQLAVFLDRESGILILHWSRQIGKSYTLAAWAVDRLLSQLQKYDSWLITVLSNSRDNGAEFNLKCAQVSQNIGAAYETEDQSVDLRYENMRMECRITLTVNGKERVGRIKVLAANPRTARGFSGDLILDEFAFHEDSNAIWEAAEPILSANREFMCRIASTGNGKHNMFYRMCSGYGGESRTGQEEKGKSGGRTEDAAVQTLREDPSRTGQEETHAKDAKDAKESGRGQPHSTTARAGQAIREDRGPFNDGRVFLSGAGFRVSRVTRSAANKMGVKVYDLRTREVISPDQARMKALDKRAYDQNYECAFNDENMQLLTHELISAAERDGIVIDEQQWSAVSLARMFRSAGELYVGNDIGRNRDLSVVCVLEKVGRLKRVIGMLRMSGLRLPAQKEQLAAVCRLPKFRRYEGDMTGLGLGLVEFLQEEFGDYRVRGVNFSSTEPTSDRIKAEGRKQETARVTEIMATEMLACFEERSVEIPNDPELRADLAKPEKITSPGGRVSIAATRDEAGHADHFWAIALAIRAASDNGTPGTFAVYGGRRAQAVAGRRERTVDL